MHKRLMNQLIRDRLDLLDALARTEMKDLESKKIMIVDDSQDSINIISNLLSKSTTVKIDSYTDEFEALKVMAKYQPDLIILDIMLKSLDGMKMGIMIKKLDLFHGPIIFVSSDGSYRNELEAMFDQDVYFISKPIDKNILIDTVVKILGKSGK